MKKFAIILLFIMFRIEIYASPIPGVGSSPVHQLLKNVAISELGFRIGAQNEGFWALQQNSSLNSTNSYQFSASDPAFSSRFAVNIDKFSSPMNLETYLKKWIKEYPYFGFEILQSKNMKIGGEKAYLIDLANRKKNKQLRQFVVVKNDFAVIMTCVDEINKFRDTSARCAELVNNFQWTMPSSY